MQQSDPNADGYRPAAYVMKRFGVTRQALNHWISHPEKFGFPPPALRIAGHRYWRLSELSAFEANQAWKPPVRSAA